MGRSSVSVWPDPPTMHAEAPDPDSWVAEDSLWVAYRTSRGDHFAIVEFSGVNDWALCSRSDAGGSERLASEGLAAGVFREIREPALLHAGLRRWVATFDLDTLDVTARTAVVVVRAVQARNARHALAMIQA